MIFQKLIGAGLAVALLVGTVETGIQHWQATPLILAAEAYEDARAEAPHPGEAPADAALAGAAHDAHDHDHDHGGAQWAPANGLERTGWTWVANGLHAFSMALLVFAVMGLWRYRRGPAPAALPLACGVALAGAISFNLWPTLGLSPEVPGMDAAPLHARQLWWTLAAGCAALACALAGFGRGGWRWAVVLGLLALPFVVGAPELKGDALAGYSPQAHDALAQLAAQFVWATSWVAVSFWVTMGIACGLAYQRWLQPVLDPLFGRADAAVASGLELKP